MGQGEIKAWRCIVCGYVHRGPTPPDTCPVCGAGRSDFEPFVEGDTPAAPDARWRCSTCGHVHEGSAAPEFCTVCGEPGSQFEKVAEGGGAAPGRHMRAVIIGGGVAGVAAAESLRQSNPLAEIVMVSSETELPYYRLNLTRVLAGEIGWTELPLHDAAWYANRKIELRLGAQVSELAPADAEVRLADGSRLAYDRLVLATGADPFVPPFGLPPKKGVRVVRTTGDVRAILDLPLKGMKCVVIGAGLLGIESGAALVRRGADVTLLEAAPWMMPRQLSKRAGEIFRGYMHCVGMKVRTMAATASLTGGDRVTGVDLQDGSHIPADLVLITVGIRSSAGLAKAAGLDVRGGIVVNDRLATSNPLILAAGDAAEYRGLVYGTWVASQYQGSIAGINAGGGNVEFGGIPVSTTLKVVGVDLVSIGSIEPAGTDCTVVEEDTVGKYVKFIFSGSHMVGTILLGDVSLSLRAKKAIETRRDFSRVLGGKISVAAVAEALQ